MGKIIGIDLGTTTSEIAYIKDGKPVMLRCDKHGSGNVIPSVVTIKDNNITVGEKARRQAVIRPEYTVSEVKRLMGTNESININGKSYKPEQISAIIIKTLKEIAEEEIGEVSEAVITVPANFDDLQRKATKDAAKIAGIKVERIINEPTAAALAYGIDNLNENKNILVYDLGGGTFDCTVIEMFNGIMDVKASRGDNKLGGKDFDKRIENYIKNYIENNIVINENKLSEDRKKEKNKKRDMEIKYAAEQAKKDLSIVNSTDIMLNNYGIDKNGDSVDIEIEFSKETFEEITKDLLFKTEKIIDEVMSASKLSESEIDIILAVGGSSRMECVHKLLKRKFGDKIKSGINPDEAVALGAAVQAGIKNDDIKSDDGIIITDACSHTLGIEVIGGGFSPIINRDEKLPCIRSEIYCTAEDYQTVVRIGAYQGEQRLAKENKFIGEFSLSGVPKNLSGKEEIEVTFKYDLNGMLDVSAKIISTGKSKSRLMDVNGFSNNEINKLRKETFEINDNNNLNYKEYELYKIAELTIGLAENKLNRLTDDDKNRESLIIILNNLKLSIVNGDEEAVISLDEKLTELLFEL